MLGIFGFLITIAVLVIVHEYGHYLAARLFQVKVITFSIGFGPKLLSFKSKHNEWRISAIPLGGYVHMLDEREGDVPSHLKQFAFNQKPPYQKIIIAAAGPLFNILFALCAYYALGLYGVKTLKPIIASMNPTLLVSNINQIHSGQSISSINGIKVFSWNDAQNNFTTAIKRNNSVSFELEENSHLNQINLDLTKFLQNHNNPSLIDLGLYPVKHLNQIAYVEPQSPADIAGLKAGDEITKINNQPINSWFNIAKLIHDSPNQKLFMQINRNTKIIDIEVTTNSTSNIDGQLSGKIGIIPTLDHKLINENSFIKKYTLVGSFAYAYDATINLINANLNILKSILTQKTSLTNVGGPISIAKASGAALDNGFKSFIDFLALISLSLAVMNLLPIPVLDGGHIVIYLTEWVLGRPISIDSQQILFKFGFIIIIGITCLAFYNDFLRLVN